MDNKLFLKATDFDGKTTNIEVTINIYQDYQRSIWREEYHDKKSDNEIHRDILSDKFFPYELHSPSNEEVYFKKSQYQALYEAIEKLPKVQRRRIILKYFNDLTIPQIANIENTSIQAIKASIRVAKNKVEKFLRKFWFWGLPFRLLNFVIYRGIFSLLKITS